MAAEAREQFELTEAGRDAVELREALVAAVKELKYRYVLRALECGDMPGTADELWETHFATSREMQPIRAVLLKHCVHEWPVKNSILFGEARG